MLVIVTDVQDTVRKAIGLATVIGFVDKIYIPFISSKYEQTVIFEFIFQIVR